MENLSRRSFLHGAAGAAGITLVSAAWARAAQDFTEPSLFEAALHRPAGAAAPESWQRVRKLFAFADTRIPMNAANLCPAFRSVSQRVAEWTQLLDLDVSFQYRDQLANELTAARSKVAAHLGVSPQDVALMRNTSEANNVISSGYPLGPDDRVLLWEENHPTNKEAWRVRQERFGFKVDCVSLKTIQPPLTEAKIVSLFEKAIQSNTRILTFTEVSNVSGIRLPAKALCALAHSKKIFVHVDGAQSWGAMATNLAQMGCDSFAASGHKWLAGPRETGVLYVHPAHAEKIAPSIVAYNGYIKTPCDWNCTPAGECKLPKDASRFETLGQRNDAALAALGDTIDEHIRIGPQQIEQRVSALATRLKEGLKKIPGVSLVTPLDPALSHGVVVFELPKTSDREKVYTGLYKAGFAGAKSGAGQRFRLCPHIYNLEDHVDGALHALAKLV